MYMYYWGFAVWFLFTQVVFKRITAENAVAILVSTLTLRLGEVLTEDPDSLALKKWGTQKVTW